MNNIFNGTSWNFSAADVWTAVMAIIMTLAPFILLYIAFAIGRVLPELIKAAISSGGDFEEMRAIMYADKYDRRGYKYMNQSEIDDYERSIRFKPWKW